MAQFRYNNVAAQSKQKQTFSRVLRVQSYPTGVFATGKQDIKIQEF